MATQAARALPIALVEATYDPFEDDMGESTVQRFISEDYTDVPPLYDELGVGELIIFDPQYKRRRGGVRWQVYQRLERGSVVRVEASNGDRVRSSALDVWIRAAGSGKDQRLRLARDPYGDQLVPTVAEAKAAAEDLARKAKVEAEEAEARAKRAEARAKRAEAKTATAEADAATAAARAEKAEAELARLRAELGKRQEPRARARRGSKG